MTRRTHLLLAVGMLLALTALGTLHVSPVAQAQGSCRASCWEAYGHCYKSTSNRQRCQAMLQRCLDGCIRSRR